VLTTAESDFGPLEPGRDVATATSAGFADSLRRLLADDARRQLMRESALAGLSASPLDVTPLADAIASVDAAAERARPYVYRPGPAPAPEAAGIPDRKRAEAEADRLRALRAEAGTGKAERVSVTAGWDALAAEISVVIPNRDYAAFVGEAVESALAAVDVPLEVIVVDDGSSDASVETLRGLMEAHGERAIQLVELGDNAGLAVARNRGFEAARAPLVLLLDADDTVLPHGPVALRDALRDDPEAAFAYGFVARSGLESEDLLGTSAWDPLLFRGGNYVPVTSSLVRRSAWERSGGFSADGLLELGWEDRDFWMRLAGAGERGAHVRRIVATYRVHDDSMSTLTNAHAAAIEAFLVERHPRLMGADDA
jgi:GT2 family glycosyltransferase